MQNVVCGYHVMGMLGYIYFLVRIKARKLQKFGLKNHPFKFGPKPYRISLNFGSFGQHDFFAFLGE